MVDRDDPHNLNRFIQAQEGVYRRALSELRRGHKKTHWMWYVFPQLDGLGISANAKYYAIKSMDEARKYVAHPVLGARLLECAEAVAGIQGRTAAEIFGFPDELKLCSCMTLFECVAGRDTVFSRVIDKFFDGERDAETLKLADRLNGTERVDRTEP